ncbi:MAG: type II toxin-antitoxin system VapC family toxin [Gammaproteobacteria bacterium]|nr:type II toxin-antitoxin system VapC family toxin [Gammaproteobacteria bacterium]MCY4281360.1 type II toxin-antitoxin system VapC family toxin [Gammaproteobacteria bacterium]
MKSFVLDNSVTMRWLLESEEPTDQNYAETVLNTLADNKAMVPNLWRLEVVNVLLNAERRKDISISNVEKFIAQLENLLIQVDPLTNDQAFSKTLVLANAYNISSYDAAYLELAVRENLPLASLDKHLIKAARKANVEIYLK